MKQIVYDPLLRMCGALAGTRTNKYAGDKWSFVIPVHDLPHVTKRCVDSIWMSAPQSEVIIVDDGSELESTRVYLDGIQGEYCKVIRNTRAVGHSASSNAGAAVSSRSYLCILNNDTVVTALSLKLLEGVLDDGAVGVAGPATSRTATEQMHSYAAWRNVKWTDNHIRGFAQYIATSRGRDVRDIEFVGGFALCVRRKVWEELSGFDQRLPDYGNEKEFCKRVRDSGLRCVWVPSAYIHHTGNLTYGAKGQEEVNRLRAKGDKIIKELARSYKSDA